jgi:hypothetical protein
LSANSGTDENAGHHPKGPAMSDIVLRRYTDIPALIHLLSRRQITLLDPQSWDDKNDSRYLALYQEKKKLASVLALCFSQSGETYHHWRVFAGGPSGVCVRFRKTALLNALRHEVPIQASSVKYLTLKDIRKDAPKVRDLPFLKRVAFEHEDEFRIIHESQTEKMRTLNISIPLSCIERITLSPWVHDALSPDIKRVLKSISGCGSLEIVRSTLISNDEWLNHGESAA